MKHEYFILKPAEMADLKEAIGRLTDRVDALHAETRSRRVRKEEQNTMLSLSETSAYLRVSRGTVFRWITNGTLTPVKVGRKNLFALSDLERVLTKVNTNVNARGYYK